MAKQDYIMSAYNPHGIDGYRYTICLSRSHNQKILGTHVNVILQFKPHAFDNLKDIKLVPYSWDAENEYILPTRREDEERLIAINNKRFKVNNLHDRLQEIHILLDNEDMLEDIEKYASHLIPKMYFYCSIKDFYTLNRNNAVNFNLAKKYAFELTDELHNPYMAKQNTELNKNLIHAQELDNEDYYYY